MMPCHMETLERDNQFPPELKETLFGWVYGAKLHEKKEQGWDEVHEKLFLEFSNGLTSFYCPKEGVFSKITRCGLFTVGCHRNWACWECWQKGVSHRLLISERVFDYTPEPLWENRYVKYSSEWFADLVEEDCRENAFQRYRMMVMERFEGKNKEWNLQESSSNEILDINYDIWMKEKFSTAKGAIRFLRSLFTPFLPHLAVKTKKFNR